MTAREKIFDNHKCKWNLVKNSDGSGSIVETCGGKVTNVRKYDSWEEAKSEWNDLNIPLSQAELSAYVANLLDKYAL